MQDITIRDIVYGNFDYMTIFPPSKEKYFSPWVINNCTILINKWNFSEIHCNYIKKIPRINDPNYRFVVIPFLENGTLPSSLPHTKQIKGQPKFTFFQKVYRRYFFSEEQKEKESFDLTTKYTNSLLSNMSNLRAISPNIAGWNESPHAINYLCCDYEIVHQTTEFNHSGNEGFLKLDSFVPDMIKPDRNILDGLALKKMITYLPNNLGNFLTFHLENCPYSIYYFIEMITDYSEILYFKSETPQNINMQLAFKEWLNNTVKSKKLDFQKFSELVKSKLSIETTTATVEDSEPKIKPQPPQWKARALFMFYRKKIDTRFSYQDTLAYFECQDSSGKSNYNQLHKAYAEIEGVKDRCLETNRQHILTAIQELEKLESCKKSLEIAWAEYKDFNVNYPIS